MIIDFNRYNGGGGSGSGVTPQEVQRQLDSALTPYWDSAITESAITEAVSGLATEQYVQDALSGVSLEGYWDSAQTQDAISAATSGKADAAVNIQATQGGFVPSWNKQGIITGRANAIYQNDITINGISKSYWGRGNGNPAPFYAPLSAGTAGEILVSTGNGAPVWSAVTMPEVKTVVDFDHTPQADRATLYAELKALYDGGSGATINKNYDFYKTVNTWQGLKIEYYTFSADTLVFGKVVSPENITDQVVYEQVMTIDSGGNVNVVTNTVGGGGDVSGYWNSAETKSYVDSAATNLQDQLDTMDEVIADALVDLNDRVDEISGSTQDMVTSTDVRQIVKLTQAAYDQLVLDGQVDPDTFYIIVNSN